MFNFFKKAPSPAVGPDYSKIDSLMKAQAAVELGDLVKLHLLPVPFGGDDSAPNTVYVPPFVKDMKDGIDQDTVMTLVREGTVTRYSAAPRYQGKSVVPISITLRATEPANFEASIAIWGDALEGNQTSDH